MSTEKIKKLIKLCEKNNFDTDKSKRNMEKMFEKQTPDGCMRIPKSELRINNSEAKYVDYPMVLGTQVQFLFFQLSWEIV